MGSSQSTSNETDTTQVVLQSDEEGEVKISKRRLSKEELDILSEELQNNLTDKNVTIDVEIYKSIGADLGIEFEDDDEEGYEEEEEYYDESIQPYELVEPIETPENFSMVPGMSVNQIGSVGVLELPPVYPEFQSADNLPSNTTEAPDELIEDEPANLVPYMMEAPDELIEDEPVNWVPDVSVGLDDSDPGAQTVPHAEEGVEVLVVQDSESVTGDEDDSEIPGCNKDSAKDDFPCDTVTETVTSHDNHFEVLEDHEAVAGDDIVDDVSTDISIEKGAVTPTVDAVSSDSDSEMELSDSDFSTYSSSTGGDDELKDNEAVNTTTQLPGGEVTVSLPTEVEKPAVSLLSESEKILNQPQSLDDQVEDTMSEVESVVLSDNEESAAESVISTDSDISEIPESENSIQVESTDNVTTELESPCEEPTTDTELIVVDEDDVSFRSSEYTILDESLADTATVPESAAEEESSPSILEEMVPPFSHDLDSTAHDEPDSVEESTPEQEAQSDQIAAEVMMASEIKAPIVAEGDVQPEEIMPADASEEISLMQAKIPGADGLKEVSRYKVLEGEPLIEPAAGQEEAAPVELSEDVPARQDLTDPVIQEETPSEPTTTPLEIVEDEPAHSVETAEEVEPVTECIQGGSEVADEEAPSPPVYILPVTDELEIISESLSVDEPATSEPVTPETVIPGPVAVEPALLEPVVSVSPIEEPADSTEIESEHPVPSEPISIDEPLTIVQHVVEDEVIAPEQVEAVIQAEEVIVVPETVAKESPSETVDTPVVAEPVEAAPEIVDKVSEPVEAAPETLETVSEPVEAEPEIVDKVSEPVEAAPEIVETVSEPVEAAPEIVELVSEPVEAAPEIVETISEPVEAGPQLVETAPESVEPGVSSTQELIEIPPEPVEPVQSAIETVEIATESVESAHSTAETIPELFETTLESVESMPEKDIPSEPEDSTAEPIRSSLEPIEASNELMETPSEPVETPSEPVETPSEPFETPSEPIETPSEPVETSSEPADASSEPAEAPSEPAETHFESTVPDSQPAPEGVRGLFSLIQKAIEPYFTTSADDEPAVSVEEEVEPVSTQQETETVHEPETVQIQITEPEVVTPVESPVLGSDPVESEVEPTVVVELTEIEPSIEPTVEPTIEPTVEPTVEPTIEPTIEPAIEPTLEPAIIEPIPTTVPDSTNELPAPENLAQSLFGEYKKQEVEKIINEAKVEGARNQARIDADLMSSALNAERSRWRSRFSSIENNLQKRKQDIGSAHEEGFALVTSKLQIPEKQDTCSGNVSDLVDCYLANPDQVLRCNQVAQSFDSCVNKALSTR